jgi:hypothetical protein
MKHSWKDKLDDQGLEMVEIARKLSQIKVPTTLDMAELRRWIERQKEVYSSHSDFDQKRKVKFELGFVRAFLRTSNETELDAARMMALLQREEFSSQRADELELHQRIFMFLESDQAIRFQVCEVVASGIVMFRQLFGPLLKMQFAAKINLRGFLAQNLEWIAGSLRGQVKKPPGRKNVDFAALVDAILEHQKEPLTQLELYEAVKASGAEVPVDPEAFRLWLHRARKQGLVKNYRSTHMKDHKK